MNISHANTFISMYTYIYVYMYAYIYIYIMCMCHVNHYDVLMCTHLCMYILVVTVAILK